VAPLREGIVASTKPWASIGEGKTHVKSAEDCVVTKALPSSRLQRTVVHGTFSFPYPDDLPGELGPGIPHHVFCYGAQVAAVEVDRELGTVHVKDMVAIHDIGRAINPPAAQGQIEGGVGQGIGYALYEQLRRREDGTWIDSFAEYLLPTALDTPNIAAELIEYPEASGPSEPRALENRERWPQPQPSLTLSLTPLVCGSPDCLSSPRIWSDEQFHRSKLDGIHETTVGDTQLRDDRQGQDGHSHER